MLAHLTDMEAAYSRVMSLGIPVVHLSGWLGGAALPRVQHDFAACAALAVEEFRELGLQRVAGLELRSDSINQRSYRGLRVALRRAGMSFDRLTTVRGLALANQASELADQPVRLDFPTGLFLPHAGLTWSLLVELHRRGIRVPDDVSIIVIDRDAQQTCALAPVPLTAVTLDDWQQGYEAASLVHRIIQGGKMLLSKIQMIAPAGLARRESTGVATNRDPVVAKAMHLVESHAEGGLSVDDVAHRVGVSRRNLEQRFRAATGTTPHAALLHQRFALAKQLLSVGRNSVADVAEACGFSSVHYFTTAFKREHGMAPGRFR